MPYLIVFITTSSGKESDLIANSLVESRIAACVNIVPGIKSIYTWKGKKESSKEYLLIVKTIKANFAKLKKHVKALHSYDMPEIIGIAIDNAGKDYLNWIKEATRGG
jgi:periplasmic divalent cation tolerance protein